MSEPDVAPQDQEKRSRRIGEIPVTVTTLLELDNSPPRKPGMVPWWRGGCQPLIDKRFLERSGLYGLANRIMWYGCHMPSKAVQISIDTVLLRHLDADPEVKEKGRSAFIRTAVRLHLAARERRENDARIAQAYGGEADSLLSEIEPLIDGQPWPEG